MGAKRVRVARVTTERRIGALFLGAASLAAIPASIALGADAIASAAAAAVGFLAGWWLDTSRRRHSELQAADTVPRLASDAVRERPSRTAFRIGVHSMITVATVGVNLLIGLALGIPWLGAFGGGLAFRVPVRLWVEVRTCRAYERTRSVSFYQEAAYFRRFRTIYSVDET